MKLENNLGLDSIKRLVVRLAIPSMLAQFVSVLYSIVDRMYIGNIPEVGELALAGAGVCGPIVTLISSFSALIGFGGAPLLSIRMGEKNNRAAKQVLANCFLMVIIAGVSMSIITLLLKEKLLFLFGASEVTFPYANEYLSIYVMGSIFAIISTGMNQFIICQGFAKISMISVMIGAAMNLILDPVFIFVLDMGIGGAALATIVSQMCSCIFVLSFLFSKKIPIPITFGNYSWRVCKSVLTLGMSPFLILAFDSILIISVNMALQHYGGAEGDTMVACATIVQSFMLIITMPLGGITAGTQTILGYNYGAGKIHRVRQAEKEILKVCLIFTGVMTVIAQTVPGYFALIFTRNEELINLSVWGIRVYTAAALALGVQYTFVDGLTGMGIARVAIFMSFFRKGLYFVLVASLPAIFGVRATFYTEPIADVIACIVSSTTYVLLSGKIFRQRLTYLRDTRRYYRKNRHIEEIMLK